MATNNSRQNTCRQYVFTASLSGESEEEKEEEEATAAADEVHAAIPLRIPARKNGKSSVCYKKSSVLMMKRDLGLKRKRAQYAVEKRPRIMRWCIWYTQRPH